MSCPYSIWIISPPGMIWSRVFEDTAENLQYAFSELGFEVPLVTDPNEIQGRAIVFGANLAPKYDVAIPEDAIVYNLEQVHADSPWFAKNYGYIDLLKRHQVWDFSEVNRQHLREFGVENVVLCPVGYTPALTRSFKGKKDIDTLFIGGASPRRQQVFGLLRDKGVKLEIGYKVFDKERDKLAARGKVHLNMHKEPAQLLEMPRMAYLLANQCFVVSEIGKDPALEAPLKDGVVFCEYDKLADTCAEYLVKPKLRKSIAEAGFEAIRALPQKAFLEAALSETPDVTTKSRSKKATKQAGDSRRIFVAVASYRDPEIMPTLHNLFSQAQDPSRIYVGVCVQADEEDTDCHVNFKTLPDTVKVKTIPSADSKGANWARKEAMEFRNGEEYVLMIDSHMRFERDWDAKLLDMIGRCPSEKPVITQYSPNYNPPNVLRKHENQILRVRVKYLTEISSSQPVHLTGALVDRTDKIRAGLYPSPFVIANFVFAPAEAFDTVPLDPRFIFWGDELNLATRLWTHGYDVFQTDESLAYHYWVRTDEFEKMQYRMRDSDDNREAIAQLSSVLQGEFAEGFGNVRPLSDFWTFAGIDWHQGVASENALNGVWNCNAPCGVPQVRAMNQDEPETRPRIFVQIASYRDPECQWTVKDMFAKATHPERINVGIVWQFVKDEDAHCFTEPYPYPNQMRVREVNALESKGACWARNMTQTLWRGEEYTLQIDSHMRFEQGWDQLLLDMWDECEDPMAVITCYPSGYEPPDKLEQEFIFGMAVKHFDKHGILLMHGKPAYRIPQQLPAKPIHAAFVSANMLFGPSSIIAEVPYDPDLYFFGEEISMAVRLWTHGYNLYHPHKPVIYHFWKRDQRRTHFDDHDWSERNNRSYARVRHMLGTEVTGDESIIAGLDRFGLGKRRSLAEYEHFSGVNFRTKAIQEHAFEGKFEHMTDDKPPVQPPSGAPIFKVQLDKNVVRKHASGDEEAMEGRIFVNIASYRDPECQWTVKDLFEKAANPERIFVGICWQFDEEEDKDCFQQESPRPDQVRIYPIDWRDAEGVCWARNKAQQLWEGEEFTLMIDSHMRFQQNWDVDLIRELARCPSAKPLLSASPEGYEPPDRLGTRLLPTVRRAKHFMPDGNVRCQGEALEVAPEAPLRGAFLVANFIFSRSAITSEVPYDPYLYFDQEEIMYAAKLYTHGWDIYHPTRQFLYHFYNTHNAPGGSVRKLHWRDLQEENRKKIEQLRARGLRRMNHMTGFEISNDPEVLKELGYYRFGSVRSLDEFEQFSGIDFKKKVSTPRAINCEFIEDLFKYRKRPFMIPPQELEFLRKGPPRPPADQQRRMPPPGERMPHSGMRMPVLPPFQVGNVAGNAALAPTAEMNEPRQSEPPRIKTDMPPIHITEPKAAPATLLEMGDYMPMFQMYDCLKRTFNIERLGGQHYMMAYLPADQEEKARAFFIHAREGLVRSGHGHVPLIVFMDDVAERLELLRTKFKLKDLIYPDPDRRVARSLGIAQTGEPIVPTGFIVDQNMKIIKNYQRSQTAALADAMVHDISLAINQYRDLNAKPSIITRNAPAVIVPDVLTPELCRKIIEAFRTGNQFDGTVGSGEGKAYRDDVKKRTDVIMPRQLVEEVDDKLSRSFFPEIKKIFGMDVTHREIYKIGLYRGDRDGFFKQHRDNFDFPMGYRHIASTIHLNDEYEGGGLRFPEYGQDIYRPPVGAGIAFSASNLHEALPVTRGERYVVVAFLHGKVDEAYRHYFRIRNHEQVTEDVFTPTIRSYPELKLWRWFYDEWLRDTVHIGENESAGALPVMPQLPAAANANLPSQKPALINRGPALIGGRHKPNKIYESSAGIIFDDFLPEETYQALHDWVVTSDYKYINTQGKISRAWHVHDGFPLRSDDTFFYHAQEREKKEPKDYPSDTAVDRFMEALLEIQPQVEHMIGEQGKNWEHFSVTSWLYPQGTGLSLHDDGSGIYTGAYAYFLNPTWRAHWGGLLILMEEESNRRVQEYREQNGQMDFFRRKFLHAGALDELLIEEGMGRCIFPKRNRIVFIANTTYHMVTRVNEASGDNIRMSLAGFFNNRRKK